MNNDEALVLLDVSALKVVVGLMTSAVNGPQRQIETASTKDKTASFALVTSLCDQKTRFARHGARVSGTPGIGYTSADGPTHKVKPAAGAGLSGIVESYGRR